MHEQPLLARAVLRRPTRIPSPAAEPWQRYCMSPEEVSFLPPGERWPCTVDLAVANMSVPLLVELVDRAGGWRAGDWGGEGRGSGGWAGGCGVYGGGGWGCRFLVTRTKACVSQDFTPRLFLLLRFRSLPAPRLPPELPLAQAAGGAVGPPARPLPGRRRGAAAALPGAGAQPAVRHRRLPAGHARGAQQRPQPQHRAAGAVRCGCGKGAGSGAGRACMSPNVCGLVHPACGPPGVSYGT